MEFCRSTNYDDYIAHLLFSDVLQDELKCARYFEDLGVQLLEPAFLYSILLLIRCPSNCFDGLII